MSYGWLATGAFRKPPMTHACTRHIREQGPSLGGIRWMIQVYSFL
ncbi:hypothetical protein ACQRBN_00740 [Bariatricus sp. SGI.154]